jgi:molybdate transport system substrate-binding protein
MLQESMKVLLAAAALSLHVAVVSAETLHVFAAASLSEAFREIGAAFERAHPGDTVELNFAGSQVLRMQIEQGAGADVFASADLVHANLLRTNRLLSEPRVFTRNRLVVIVPVEGKRVKALSDIAKPGVKLVVAGDTVPAGRYAKQVVAQLGASGLYGADFVAGFEANVVSQETNVRAVQAKVALGEADAGIVYVTDAAGDDRVRTIAIPERYNVVAEYAIGVVVNSPAESAAESFVAFVLGAKGQAVLVKHGFAR